MKNLKLLGVSLKIAGAIIGASGTILINRKEVCEILALIKKMAG